MRRRLTSTFIAAALTVAAFGCNDAPQLTSPQRFVANGTARGSLIFDNPVTVAPLTRTTALPLPMSASKVIGVLGGTIALPQAGLTVTIPPLALSSPTTITVTALAGSNVAYEFEPHGTVFNAGVVLAQDLNNTDAAERGTIDPLSLSVGYFTNSANIASISELLNASADVANQLSISTVWHFSGYMWATGRTDDE
jgi:hypothetical protein